MIGHLGPRVAAASASAVAGCLRDPDVKGRRAAAAALAKLGQGVSGPETRIEWDFLGISWNIR